MSFSARKTSPLVSVPYLKKRLRRITALGLYNLTVNEFYFSIHFTLHRNENTVAFYTSESVVNQRNPEWSYLQFPTSVQCLQEFFMRLWITSGDKSRLFLEYDIHLDDSLKPDEQKNKFNKDNNSIWLEMFGYRFTDNDADNNIEENNEELISMAKKKRPPSARSYSKLSIIRMNNIIHAIRSERQASLVYLRKIQTSVDENNNYLSKIKERELREIHNESLSNYLQYQIYLHQQRIAIYQQRQRKLAERRFQLTYSLSQLEHEKEEILLYYNNLEKLRSILRNLIRIIFYRRNEILNEIYRYIYPIQNDNQNVYRIANIKLPQADDKIYKLSMNPEQENEMAASIGYCSHLVLIISQLIQLPLRFPIDYHGISAMKIYDYTLEMNEFPLYPEKNLSSFRYAFYLLNRNIVQIMDHCRISDHNVDFRNTLENLKQLIEQYFINSNIDNQTRLYPSLQTTSSASNDEDDDEASIRNKQKSDDSSLFLSSCSSTTSLIENDDYGLIEDIELFSPMKSIEPKLSMQISHQ